MKLVLIFLRVKNSMYYSFFDNVKKGNVILSKKNKRGELILLKDDGNKQKNSESSKKITHYQQAFPWGSVRAKNENDEAFVSFTELSNKESDMIKVNSSKKKPVAYKIDYWNYIKDACDKKLDYKK